MRNKLTYVTSLLNWISLCRVRPLFIKQTKCPQNGLGKDHNICDRLWDFGPYGGTWAKLGFLYNLKCSSVLGILVNF